MGVSAACARCALLGLTRMRCPRFCAAQLRMKDKDPYVTDNANYIIDLYFETPMKDAVAAGKAISELVGVVEHGLFLNMCDVCIIAGKTGIEIKERNLNRK